ncbi:MAG: hypothetical protein JKY94_16040 [Rhodobacteraceae bacterium]|nr:hypothetical protein [Paracoccaceae bacterium]
MTKITNLTTHDLTFSPAKSLDGSGTGNPRSDFSAVYVERETDRHQIEFVYHQEEHFLDRRVGRNGDYMAADTPGLSIETKSEMTKDLASGQSIKEATL